MSENLEQGADELLDVARKLIAASENAGYANAKELVESIYPNRLQNKFIAMRLLQKRHDHLSEVELRKSALDESRQNLSTLIDDAHYVSHIENGISMLESIITKIYYLVTLMSERLNSLADSDNDLAKQDSLLIKE